MKKYHEDFIRFLQKEEIALTDPRIPIFEKLWNVAIEAASKHVVVDGEQETDFGIMELQI